MRANCVSCVKRVIRRTLYAMTETANAKGAKTRTNVARPAQVAWVVFFAFALIVAASSFALTYHGLYGYGRKVAHLGDFAWLVPVAVDGATLCAIAATFLLAHTALRVRAYAWLVFFATNALSVLGNLAFAHAAGLGWQGSVGAAAWPVLVTLVAHLGIVAWRHRPGAQPTYQHTINGAEIVNTVEVCDSPGCLWCDAATNKPRSPAPVEPPAQPTPERGTGQPVPTTPAPRRPAAPSRGRRGGPRRTTPQQKTRALALLDEGQSAAKAAIAVGVSKRLVEIWRKERDDQHKPGDDQEGEVS
jgi:hypothetical protein